jgi:hypothetical protein
MGSIGGSLIPVVPIWTGSTSGIQHIHRTAGGYSAHNLLKAPPAASSAAASNSTNKIAKQTITGGASRDTVVTLKAPPSAPATTPNSTNETAARTCIVGSASKAKIAGLKAPPNTLATATSEIAAPTHGTSTNKTAVPLAAPVATFRERAAPTPRLSSLQRAALLEAPEESTMEGITGSPNDEMSRADGRQGKEDVHDRTGEIADYTNENGKKCRLGTVSVTMETETNISSG